MDPGPVTGQSVQHSEQGNRLPPIRVVLVDDQGDFLRWVREQLAGSTAFDVVGETTQPEQAISLIQTTQPDALLVDFEMPGINGFELTRRVREEFPSVQVLLMSMHNSSYFEVLARLAGARGFLAKDRFDVGAIEALLR